MIFDTLDHAETLYTQSAGLKKAFCFFNENDLSLLVPGKTAIHEDELYINRMTYQTGDAQTRVWEAHRRYIDIHVVLSGEEIVYVSNLA